MKVKPAKDRKTNKTNTLTRRDFVKSSLVTGAALALPGCATMEKQTAGTTLTLVEDGAWCWFQDERAVIVDTRNKMTVGSITSTGDVRVTTYDFTAGTVTTKVLHRNFEHDDHNVPGILVRSDGYLMAFYTRHGKDALMRYRVSTNPNDGTSWQPEQTYNVNVSGNFTYANPFQLSAEADKIYMFWRGIDWNPTYTTSTDNGQTWSEGKNVIYFRKRERPYVKYASNNIDTIHFAFTEGHPDRPYKTSLYHAYYKAGKLYTTDGAFICNLADRPIRPSEATQIYDGVSSPTGEAWVWDIALNSSSEPVIAYSTHLNPNDHRYRYARWNRQTRCWQDHQIAYAGTRLYPKQSYYSGGIALDPDNPNVVYISSDVNIYDGSPNDSGHYEIFKGLTTDSGATWAWKPITSNSTEDNLRPIVPAYHPGETFVLWMKGTYIGFIDYKTHIVLKTDARLLAVMN